MYEGPSRMLSILLMSVCCFSVYAQKTTTASKSNYDRKGVAANVRVAYQVQKSGKEEVYFAVAAQVTINASAGYNYEGRVYGSEVPGLMDVLNKTQARFPTVIFDIYYNSIKQGTKKFAIASRDDLSRLTGDGFTIRTSEAAANNPGGWVLQAVDLETFNYHPDPTAWMAAEYAIKDFLKASEQRNKYAERIRDADRAYGSARTIEELAKARALYYQAHGILPEEAYPRQRIEQIDARIKELREQEAQAREEEAKRKAEEEERKRQEEEQRRKEEEERRLAEQMKAEQEKKAEEERQAQEVSIALAEEQRLKQEEEEAEKRRAEEAVAAAQAEAERLEREREEQERFEREYQEKRRREKEADERAWSMKESIEQATEQGLKREWEAARANWDRDPPTGAEERRRYDEATAIMTDAKLMGDMANIGSVREAIRLYPYHPDVTRWIREGGFKAGWDYLSADYEARYKEVREFYQQSLTYEEQRNIALHQIQQMSRRFSEMADLKHNFKDPRALLASVNRRMNLISQQRSEASQFHIDNLDAKLKKNETLNNPNASETDRAIVAVTEGLTTAIDMINSNAEAKRARERLESEKRWQMEEIRDGLLEDARGGMAELKSSFFNTDDLETEKAALNKYYNLLCYEEQVRTQFSYNSTAWYDNYCPVATGDQYYKSLQVLRSSSPPLNVASRKAQLYAATKIEAFKEGALFRLGEVVKNSTNNKENLFYSYHIYQQLSSDEIERIQYQFAKHAVMPNREEAGYVAADKRLKEIIDNCIQKSDARTLKVIVEKKLHRQIGSYFSEVSLPAIIKGDKSSLLSMVLEQDAELNTPQFKNSLLIESVMADAASNVRVLVAKGANVNQKLKDRQGTAVPLVLIFSGKKTGTLTHLVNKNTEFGAVNALLTDDEEREQFYARMLRVAVVHDNVFAMKAVAAHSRAYLITAANANHNLFEEAVQHNSARVLDSLFHYSKNDHNKNYLVFSTSHVPVFNVMKRHGLDLNYKNNEGVTALHVAVENNDLATVTNLMNAGADGAVLDKKGFSPMHLAAYSKNGAAMRAMAKADKRVVATRDKNFGWTPLHFAARENYLDGCTILIDNGADKKAKDNWGRTPFQIAKERYFVSLKRVLK